MAEFDERKVVGEFQIFDLQIIHCEITNVE